MNQSILTVSYNLADLLDELIKESPELEEHDTCAILTGALSMAIVRYYFSEQNLERRSDKEFELVDKICVDIREGIQTWLRGQGII